MQLAASLLISLTAAFTFGTALTVFGQEKEWLTYEDPFLGVKIQHPSDWTRNATESTIF
jgi:hypothetical protein